MCYEELTVVVCGAAHSRRATDSLRYQSHLDLSLFRRNCFSSSASSLPTPPCPTAWVSFAVLTQSIVKESAGLFEQINDSFLLLAADEAVAAHRPETGSDIVGS